MSTLLSALKTTETVEEVVDSIGGVKTLDSGVYPVTIAAMFVGQSSGKATFVTVHAKTQDGYDFKTTQYVTSGEAKGGKHYYTKDGKNYNLPGYNVINAITMLACNKSIDAMDLEEKVINLWDYDAQKELPTKVSMLVEALNQPIALGIQKQIVDKRKKNDATGQYEPTGETREINELDAVFCAETGRTYLEAKTDSEAVFLGKWKDKNKDQVINKSKGLEGKTGAIAKSGEKSKPSKSLFA